MLRLRGTSEPVALLRAGGEGGLRLVPDNKITPRDALALAAVLLLAWFVVKD